MTKLSVIFLIVLSVLVRVSIQENSNYNKTNESAYIQTLKLLYRGIEPPKISNNKGKISNVKIEYIQQKLDNWNPISVMWNMRYMSNDEFHKPNGPIFIFVGGEHEIEDNFIRGGILHEMAREHSGYLFLTEHRFYGKSMPTADLSMENLQYLTSQQALADLANFIRTQKYKPQFARSKIILVGGSYSGSLAVWFQRLYPDLVDGSWASSAPLLAQVDFPEFREFGGRAFRTLGGEACYNRIYNGIRKLEEYIDKNKTKELQTVMKLCGNFNPQNWLDVGALFTSISNVAAAVVQYHKNGDIQRECQIMLAESDDVTGLAFWVKSKVAPAQCYDYTFPATVGYIKVTQISGSIWRQWTYQTCNELGFAHTSNSSYQPFGTKIPVQFYEHICLDVFGITRDQFWANAEKTNKYYGGLAPDIKNVYYSHGGIDPWNKLGIQINDDGTNAVIPNYAHCMDLDSVSISDTAEMRASKEKLKTYVRKWLA